MMDATVEQDSSENVEKYCGENEKEIIEADHNLNKDSLVFHGVAFDKLEEETKQDDAAIKKNFIEHKIRSIMKSEWGIDCNASFKHVFRYILTRLCLLILTLLCRWAAGPRVNGVEPILVVFEDKHDKEQLWMKLSLKLRDDLVERRESVIVTQVYCYANTGE